MGWTAMGVSEVECEVGGDCGVSELEGGESGIEDEEVSMSVVGYFEGGESGVPELEGESDAPEVGYVEKEDIGVPPLVNEEGGDRGVVALACSGVLLEEGRVVGGTDLEYLGSGGGGGGDADSGFSAVLGDSYVIMRGK